MNFKPYNIPFELKNLRQWVCFKIKKTDEKTQKFMISPITGKFAKSNENETWSDFKTAYNYMIKNRLHGLAFVLTEGIVFIDIDHSIDSSGTLSDLTVALLDLLPNTYAEKSVSGSGIHILCYGNLPINCNKRNDKIGLEMYDTKRFICITGDLINDRKYLKNYSDLIPKLNEKYMGKKPVITKPIVTTNVSFADNELIDKIKRSKIGYKFEKLYSGDISEYPSHSNADFALVRILAFWTQDRLQIDSIFRSSGLFRDKWDRKIGDSTYGDITINNALSTITKTYNYQYDL